MTCICSLTGNFFKKAKYFTYGWIVAADVVKFSRDGKLVSFSVSLWLTPAPFVSFSTLFWRRPFFGFGPLLLLLLLLLLALHYCQLLGLFSFFGKLFFLFKLNDQESVELKQPHFLTNTGSMQEWHSSHLQNDDQSVLARHENGHVWNQLIVSDEQ